MSLVTIGNIAFALINAAIASQTGSGFSWFCSGLNAGIALFAIMTEME